MKILIAVGILALAIPFAVYAASTGHPATPVNLQASAVTPTSITLAYGPSQPGPFKVTAVTSSQVTVAWGPSSDSRSPVTYTIQWQGSIVERGFTGTYMSFPVKRSQKSFRLCVRGETPTLIGAYGCATFTRR